MVFNSTHGESDMCYKADYKTTIKNNRRSFINTRKYRNNLYLKNVGYVYYDFGCWGNKIFDEFKMFWDELPKEAQDISYLNFFDSWILKIDMCFDSFYNWGVGNYERIITIIDCCIRFLDYLEESNPYYLSDDDFVFEIRKVSMNKSMFRSFLCRELATALSLGNSVCSLRKLNVSSLDDISKTQYTLEKDDILISNKLKSMLSRHRKEMKRKKVPYLV